MQRKNLQKTLLHRITGKSQVPQSIKIYQFSTFAISSQALVRIII